MSVYETTTELQELILDLIMCLREAKAGNRQAARKARLITIELSRLGAEFRHESMNHERVCSIGVNIRPGRPSAGDQVRELFKYKKG